MKSYVEAFPNHVRDAIEIAKSYAWADKNAAFKNVVVSGLGGSGIGGTIVSQTIASHCNIPVVVNKDYSVPNFINSDTLFVASSYSGNTEETLEALEKAEEKGATVAALTSSGKLLEIAKAKGYKYIKMPEDFPPRAAFGYSCTLLFHLMWNYGLVEDALIEGLGIVPQMIDDQIDDIKKQGKDLAEKLYKKIPVIYTDARLEGAAIRFKQQINENSKMLAWTNPIPEMNHNELVGWAEQHPELAPVFMRTKNDYFRTAERMEFSKVLMNAKGVNCVELWANYDSDVMNTYFLVSVTDWASVYLAELKGIDAVEVDVITELKNKLANI